MKEVYVNNKLVDFLQAAKTRHKVTPGCSMYQDEQPDNPCENHKCGSHGKCAAAEGADEGYRCVCKSGYKGQFCDVKSKFSLLGC